MVLSTDAAPGQQHVYVAALFLELNFSDRELIKVSALIVYRSLHERKHIFYVFNDEVWSIAAGRFPGLLLVAEGRLAPAFFPSLRKKCKVHLSKAIQQSQAQEVCIPSVFGPFSCWLVKYVHKCV